MGNNNTIDMQNESLEEPLQILVTELKKSDLRKYTCINDFGYSQIERNIVEQLTNWQKEKDKAVIDKLIEALKNVIARCEFELEGMKVLNDIEFVRAKQLLNKIEKETL